MRFTFQFSKGFPCAWKLGFLIFTHSCKRKKFIKWLRECQMKIDFPQILLQSVSTISHDHISKIRAKWAVFEIFWIERRTPCWSDCVATAGVCYVFRSFGSWWPARDMSTDFRQLDGYWVGSLWIFWQQTAANRSLIEQDAQLTSFLTLLKVWVAELEMVF